MQNINFSEKNSKFSALAKALVARLSAHKFSFVGQDFLKCHLWAEGTVK